LATVDLKENTFRIDDHRRPAGSIEGSALAVESLCVSLSAKEAREAVDDDRDRGWVAGKEVDVGTMPSRITP
jgi:hypothetical protein